ncbi:MAG: recombination protein O N-terminal domain-containing protein [Patescibacteria group bacterium]|nr:recombination protein O N-terminal domain-containing protein [Patescibacteria group bacterium]
MEYLTLGLVLSKERGKEADSNLRVYTRDFGGVAAISRSLGKITSKLSGHLLPGKLVSVRLVERNNGGWQAVDALSVGSLPATAETLKFLDFLEKVIPFNEPDRGVWEKVEKIVGQGKVEKADYVDILDVLGLGGSLAKCVSCGGSVAYFLPKDVIFICHKCLARSFSPEDEAIDI